MINIDSRGFNFSQSMCTQKLTGIPSDENNQGLNVQIYLYIYIYIV